MVKLVLKKNRCIVIHEIELYGATWPVIQAMVTVLNEADSSYVRDRPGALAEQIHRKVPDATAWQNSTYAKVVVDMARRTLCVYYDGCEATSLSGRIEHIACLIQPPRSP